MEQVSPLNEEIPYSEGRVLISQTDLDGNITFVNRKLCEISGYQVNELMGQPHNILRHPEMPKTLFAKMWENINSGQAWNGIIKNLAKDGRFFWTDIEILPAKDNADKITGFIAVMKPASPKDIQESQDLYQKMLTTEES
jgi:PAS domain S-box-containing protein